MSTSIRRSTRTSITPTRYNPCPTKKYCSRVIRSTEKKELITKFPVLDLTDSCCICMEDVDSKKNCVTTECGHTFCASCLIRHLEENNTCPLCRFVLRRPVKKTPSLSPSVAESLVAGLSNSDEERQDADDIAREMYIQVLNEQGHNVTDREAAWRNASISIRTKLVELMCGYQIILGMNVCREISQWIRYASTDQTNGPPNLSEIESSMTFPPQINQLMRNLQVQQQWRPIAQRNNVVEDGEDSDDDMPDLVAGNDSDDDMPVLVVGVDDYPIFDDIDQPFIGPNNIPFTETHPIIPNRSYNRQPPPPPLTPPPRMLTPLFGGFTHSDRDVINYMFGMSLEFEQLEEVHGAARLPRLIGSIEGNSLLPEFPAPGLL